LQQNPERTETQAVIQSECHCVVQHMCILRIAQMLCNIFLVSAVKIYLGQFDKNKTAKRKKKCFREVYVTDKVSLHLNSLYFCAMIVLHSAVFSVLGKHK